MKDIINKEIKSKNIKMYNIQQNNNNNLKKMNNNILNSVLRINKIKPNHVHKKKKYTLDKNIIINLLSVFYKIKKKKNMNIIISKNKSSLKKIFKKNKIKKNKN